MSNNDNNDQDDINSLDDQLEMTTLLPHSPHQQQQQNEEGEMTHKYNHRNMNFPHLISRMQPSKLLYYDQLLSSSTTVIVIICMIVVYIGIIARYIYLRYVNQPSDIVAFLMIHILLQLGIEMYSKLSFLYFHGKKVLTYQRLQISFGWQSIFILISLLIVCLVTVNGTMNDFKNAYTKSSLEKMIAWRFILAFFCWLMANDNTYQASLYYENFFIRNVHPCIYLRPTLDLTLPPKSKDTASDGVVIQINKSPEDMIIQRVKVLMPTFVAQYRILTTKSIFNVINSAIFFILSVGFIGHSQANGMFYYNIYMIMVMSIISFTSFSTITHFNKIMDMIEASTCLKLHLHIRVSSYAVDDRFLTLTTGAALLQVVIKALGVS